MGGEGGERRRGLPGGHAGNYSATTDATTGAWKLSLLPVPPTLVPTAVAVRAGAAELHLTGVLFGSLIVCGGQSNGSSRSTSPSTARPRSRQRAAT